MARNAIAAGSCFDGLPRHGHQGDRGHHAVQAVARMHNLALAA
jgi:hypothetical protein